MSKNVEISATGRSGGMQRHGIPPDSVAKTGES